VRDALDALAIEGEPLRQTPTCERGDIPIAMAM